jgi:hypothetical protein
MDTMRRLLAVSDLYPVPGDSEPGNRTVFPALPALCELLRMGAAGHIHNDWRQGLASDLGAAELGGLAPGSVAACAVETIEPGRAVCMATAVHMIAGMASVHLHPAGLLTLEPAEALELQRGFEHEFGSVSQRLHRVGSGLLLESALAAAANAPDPALLLGSPLEGYRTSDPGRQELRRLGVEVEMWLTGLQLNRKREQQGKLPVTGLWFWGGGTTDQAEAAAMNLRAVRTWNEAHGDDPWLSGCWRRLAGKNLVAAHGWDRVEGDSALAVVSAVRGLPAIEREWFEPALHDLRAGRVSLLILRIGGRSWQLGTRSRLRWWRRTRPWWQVLAA